MQSVMDMLFFFGKKIHFDEAWLSLGRQVMSEGLRKKFDQNTDINQFKQRK